MKAFTAFAVALILQYLAPAVAGEPEGREESLKRALQSEDPAERRTAILLLEPEKNAAATDVLLRLLRTDKDRRVRECAAWRLGEIPTDPKGFVDARIITGLADALADSEWSVVDAAIDSLRALGPSAKAAISALCEVTRSQSYGVPFRAASALLEIDPGNQVAMSVFVNGLFDPHSRYFAFSAVGYLGLNDLREVVTRVAAMLKSPQAARRQTAAEVLGRIRLKKVKNIAMPALIEALCDPEKSVRYSAAFALHRFDWNSDRPVPVLMEALEDQAPEQQLEALGQMGWIAARPFVFLPISPAEGRELRHWFTRFQCPNHEIRWEAAKALGRIEAPAKAALPALRKASWCPDPEVRDAARHAIHYILD